MKKGLIIVGVVVALLAVFGYSSYNGLVSKDEQVGQAWSQVQTVMQRRGDLIPNLVNTVKGYASHEKEIFESVAQARGQLAGARTPAEMVKADAALSSNLSRLIAIAENYPTLKADANFRALQDEIAGTENRIAVERGRYNEAVKELNSSIRRFPASIFAGMFGFSKKDYFEADAKAAAVPNVQF